MIALAVASSLLLAPVPFSNSFYDDFNDGNANGWSSDHGDWSVLFGIYRGIGRPAQGRVDNVSWATATYGTGMSAEGYMSSDTGSDDVSKMLVLRYWDSSNYIIVNFRAGWRHDVTVEQVLAGQKSYLVPEFLYNIPEHTQASWHACRADIIGNRVIAYFDGQMVMDASLPGIIVPEGFAGVNVFSSGGGDEEVYVDWYSWCVTAFSVADSIQMLVGASSTGGLAQVEDSDNVYYQITPTFTIARGMPNAVVVWKGHVPLYALRQLIVRFESSVTSSQVQQKLEVYNWATSQYELLDTRLIGSTDTPVRLDLANLTQYVGPAGEVWVRSTYFASATGSRFTIRIDEVRAQAVAQ